MAWLSRIVQAWRVDQRGVAALEFVLILPVIMVMSLGLADVYVEHATRDQFLRYVHQAGDLVSREPSLTTASISDTLDVADLIVFGFDDDYSLEIHVSSIGFKTDGTPTLLWTRSAGGAAVTPDPADVTALGLPADTVIRFEARMTYESPFNYVWSSKSHQVTSVAYFRPRETRAISMDGAVSEYDQNWDQPETGY